MNIQIGNTEGQYFTEWRFDELRYLAEILNRRLAVEDFVLFYDPNEDFHHLTFEYYGHKVDIRFYKVFAESIDGKDGWVGCLRSNVTEFIHNLYKKLRPLAVHPVKKMTIGEAIEQIRLCSDQQAAEQKMLDFMIGFASEGEQTMALVGGAYPATLAWESKALLDWENQSIWSPKNEP